MRTARSHRRAARGLKPEQLVLSEPHPPLSGNDLYKASARDDGSDSRTPPKNRTGRRKRARRRDVMVHNEARGVRSGGCLPFLNDDDDGA